MTEQKLFEGVYFTDYRTAHEDSQKSKCAGKEADKEPMDPSKVQFITQEKLDETTDPVMLNYYFESIFSRYRWLLSSTIGLLEDTSLWIDEDIQEAIEENLPLIDKYSSMLKYLISKKAGEDNKVIKEKVNEELAQKLAEQYEFWKKKIMTGKPGDKDEEEEGIFV